MNRISKAGAWLRCLYVLAVVSCACCGSDEGNESEGDARIFLDGSNRDGAAADASDARPPDDARQLREAGQFADADIVDGHVDICSVPPTVIGAANVFYVPSDIAVTREGFVHAAYIGVNIGGAVPYYTNASGSWTEELVKHDSFYHAGTRLRIVPVYGQQAAHLFAAGSWVENRSGSWSELDVPLGREAGGGADGALYGFSVAHFGSDREGEWKPLLAVGEQHGCQAIGLGADDRIAAGCLRRNIETALHELHYVQEDAQGAFQQVETGLTFDRPNTILVAAGVTRPQFAIAARGGPFFVKYENDQWSAEVLPTGIEAFAVSGSDDSAHLLDGSFSVGLRHHTNRSGQWVTTQIDPKFTEGMADAIFDEQDRLHIAYAGQYEGGKRTKYTRWCF